MIGKFWDDLIFIHMEHFRQEWISSPLYGLMGLLLVVGVALPWVISKIFTSYLLYVIPMAILSAGGSLILFFLFRHRHYGAILFLLIGMMASGLFYTSSVVFPLVNPYKSARFISEEVKSRILPGEKLGIYGDLGTGPYNFYTGIVPILELERKEDLFQFLQLPGRIFCLLRFRDFNAIQTIEGWPKVQLIARHRIGSNDMVLISNR
jgi:hypothetical protein